MKPFVPPQIRNFAKLLGVLATGRKLNYTGSGFASIEDTQSLASTDSPKAMVAAMAFDFFDL